MPEQMTHADSVRLYLTGATSDGAAQADVDLSLGNFRSSTEVTNLTSLVSNPISNVTVDFISGANGEGVGTLTSTGINTLTWTPPGGTAGAAVTINDGETKLLEGGAAPEKFIRVTRTSATDLAGAASLTLTNAFNNVIGFDNVSSAEAAAGDTEYRAIILKNVAATGVKNTKVFIGQIGGSKVSGAAQLGASGAGSISLSSSNFNDWPQSGFCRIQSSAGALKEIVYYSSRTSTSLTVQSVGRGQLGTAAQSGAATDLIFSVPGIRIGKEAPVSNAIQTIADESTSPTGIIWLTSVTSTNGVDIGDVAAGEMVGLWIERSIVAGATAEASVLNKLQWSFDAA